MKLNVPYFRQENETHCGVACVRMVLSFYGLEASEYELAESCETGWLVNKRDSSIYQAEFRGHDSN